MASNEFLPLGTTTPLTLLYDTPKEGSTRFGPYRAYRVQTLDGAEHTFFPPRSLYPELDRLNLRRGSCLSIRASQRVSDDGRVFPRFDIADVTAPASPTSASPAPVTPTAPKLHGERSSMLACVALKAAAGCGGADEERVLVIADRFLAWLQARST
ncbi:MAG: hypothetical protein ABIT01_06310 [Thermoanaerobaculia bacterium]